jgi:signal recognition particle subunit SRP54
MGDVRTLIERAEAALDAEEAARLEKKLSAGKLDLEDFLGQLQQMKKMGPLREILGLIPGLGNLKKDLPMEDLEGNLKRVEAILRSMTPQERRKPDVLNASRKRRIAAGSGTSVTDINDLLRQFRQMQSMMQQISRGKMPRGFPR